MVVLAASVAVAAAMLGGRGLQGGLLSTRVGRLGGAEVPGVGQGPVDHALGGLGGVVHVGPHGRRGEPGLGSVGARGSVLPAGGSQRLSGQRDPGEERGLVDVVGRVLGVLKLGTVEVRRVKR